LFSRQNFCRDPETEKFIEYSLIRDINLFEEKHYFFTHDLDTGIHGFCISVHLRKDKGILILRIEESLYFANVGQVKELFQKIEQRGNSPLNAIIFDASNVPNVDTDAIQVLLEMVLNKK
jgi:MFS superfamily sulfate permease-like transporter